MNKIELASGAILYHGDMREALKLLPENSIDSVVCDPPYHLTSIVKRFGGKNAAPAQHGTDGAYARASKGFMNKQWDGGDIAFQPETWAEVLRVLKPGGHVAAFGASRGYHRMACAIEDAGFEIRDSLMWIYGVGFPKSHDVAKGINTKLTVGSARTEDMRRLAMGDDYEPSGRGRVNYDHGCGSNMSMSDALAAHDVPLCAAARQWGGWGTALKPAFEPIVLARKPLSEGTVAANVLRWGTGALNIDGCRVTFEDGDTTASGVRAGQGKGRGSYEGPALHATVGGVVAPPHALGRWPANVVHDGSDEVVGAFPDSKGQLAPISTKTGVKTSNVYGKMNREGEASANKRYTDQGSTNFAPLPGQRRGDSGSAARFFYSAKASKADRAGSKHPTVKPVKLLQWLTRLITPPGGMVLDPFAGSGTTGAAAEREGFQCILIEREDEYVEDIKRRMALPVAAAVAAQQPANDNRPRDLFGEAA